MKYFDLFNSLKDNKISIQDTEKSYIHFLTFFELSLDQNNEIVWRSKLMNILAHLKYRWNVCKRRESLFIKNNTKWLNNEINLNDFAAGKITFCKFSIYFQRPTITDFQ